MKKMVGVLGILAAVYFLPTIGMNVAASSRGVASIQAPTDSWIARKLSSWQDVRAYRIKVDPARFPSLDEVVAAARPAGKMVEKAPGEVVYQTAVSGLERAIEFRLVALDDPEKLENTLTVVEATRCTESMACYRHSVMKAFDSARSAYALSNLAGIRKTPNAG